MIKRSLFCVLLIVLTLMSVLVAQEAAAVDATAINNYLEVVKKIADVYKTESSSEIKQIIKEDAFKKLNIMQQVDRAEGVSVKTLKKKVNRLRDQTARSISRNEDKLEFLNAIEDFKDIIEDEDGKRGRSGETFLTKFGYQDNDGRFMMLGIAFRFNKDYQDYSWSTFIQQGEFELAPTMVITRETSKSLFDSESRDVIQYIPTNLTPAQAKALTAEVLPSFAIGSAQMLLSMQGYSNQLLNIKS